jgi:hypothetical protein
MTFLTLASISFLKPNWLAFCLRTESNLRNVVFKQKGGDGYCRKSSYVSHIWQYEECEAVTGWHANQQGMTMSLGRRRKKKCLWVQMNLKISNEKCLSDHVINDVQIPPQSLTLKMAIASFDETSEIYYHSTRPDHGSRSQTLGSNLANLKIKIFAKPLWKIRPECL